MADFTFNFEEIKELKQPISQAILVKKNLRTAAGEVIKLLKQKNYKADFTNTGVVLKNNTCTIYCDSTEVNQFTLKLTCLNPGPSGRSRSNADAPKPNNIGWKRPGGQGGAGGGFAGMGTRGKGK